MDRPLSSEVESLLRCPKTQQPLRLATAEELSTFKEKLSEGAWITEDGSRAYPIRDGFPILVLDESVTVGGE